MITTCCIVYEFCSSEQAFFSNLLFAWHFLAQSIKTAHYITGVLKYISFLFIVAKYHSHSHYSFEKLLLRKQKTELEDIFHFKMRDMEQEPVVKLLKARGRGNGRYLIFRECMFVVNRRAKSTIYCDMRVLLLSIFICLINYWTWYW